MNVLGWRVWTAALTLTTAPACRSDGASGGALGGDEADAGPGGAGLVYHVMVEVSGLHGSLTVGLDGEELVIDADGSHAFPTALRHGSDYQVTLAAAPGIQRCRVTGGSGTISASDAIVSVRCADRYFFVGGDPDHGLELWSSDVTAERTGLVADLWPGPDSSQPSDFTRVGDQVYFVAVDPDHGRQVWRTDGTEAGTHRVADLAAGSDPGWLVGHRDRLYFIAGVYPQRFVYRTDGTPGGTAPLSDIPVFPDRDNTCLGLGDDELFLVTRSSTLWRRLYAIRMDGSGTAVVKDSHPSMHGVTATAGVFTGGMYLFEGVTATGGRELWRSDGTATGTARVMAAPEGQSSFPVQEMTPLAAGVIFRGTDGQFGMEPWISDGTTAGTVQLVDLPPSDTGSNPRDFVAFAGRVAFAALVAEGTHLFVSDGQNGATAISPSSTYAALMLSVSGEQILFSAYDWEGDELWLWRYQLAGAQATRVKRFAEILPALSTRPIFGSTAFVADDGTGYRLWRSDGTAAGTRPLGP